MVKAQSSAAHDLLPVGEVAARAGLAVSALRHYEAQGLIHGVRSSGNHRRYPRSVLRRLAVIRTAQRLGLPLAEIGAALATLPDQRTPTARDWARMAQRWRHALDERIQALTALRDQLDRCIGCGCLSVRDCALRNPHDSLADAGPGARLLSPAPTIVRTRPRE